MKFDIFQRERESAETLPCGIKVLKGDTAGGKPFVMVWRPKAIKPHAHYHFQTVEKRDEFIAREIADYEDHLKRKQEYKTSRAGTDAQMLLVQVGFIFEWSWGYDQTNLQYFQVIEKTGRMVKVREIGQSAVSRDGLSSMAEMRQPTPGHFLDKEPVLTKKVQFSQGQPYLPMKYGWCGAWKGRPSYCSWYA